jgi:hypothetical protein
VARKLHELRKELEVDRGPLLRKFWDLAHRLLSMPEYMVSRVLYFEQRDPVPCGPVGKPKRKRKRRRSGSTDFSLGEARPKRQR